MEDHTPVLDPSELYQKRKSKDIARLKTYNKILEQIFHRIRVISRLPNYQCYLLYTIPPFILGLPKIDIEDCVVYLIYQLRNTGYEVRYTFPNLLYISWVHHEKSYLIEQSPIMSAMMESAERAAAEKERKEKEASRLLAPRKSQRKVKFQSPGALSSPSGSAPGTMKTPSRAAIKNVLSAGPPPPSASEYIPPTSFLQNMSNPANEIVYPKSVPDYFS
jgi:hypothetical protein